MEIKQKNLKKMLQARHIVFIGSRDVVQQGIENCTKAMFSGEIFAIHPTAVTIAGVHCYKSIGELPLVPDAAFLSIRSDRTIAMIEKLRDLGVAGCVCYAAGFSEVGNYQLHQSLIEAAGDMALVGPNCYGMINFLDGIPLWPDYYASQTTEEGVAIISQSGNISFNITMNDRSLPIAYILSIGNQASLDMADYILVLCDDPRVTAIGLHIEGLGNMEKFLYAANVAREKGIPLVALKTGVSEVGSRLTISHTSSLAGSDDLYEALFKRLNISRVDSLSAFLETLKLFSLIGNVVGRNLGVLTCSGGESTLTADIAEQQGFTLPPLQSKQTEELNALLTKFEHVSNPLDYNTSIWGDKENLTTCFNIFMQDQFDMTLLVLDYLNKEASNIQAWQAAIDAFIEAQKQTNAQAMVISVLQEGMPEYFREKLIANGIAPLQGMTDAFIAITAVTSYNERKQQTTSIPNNLLLPEAHMSEDNIIVLDEWQGKQALSSFGLRIPSGKVVSFNEDIIIHNEMVGPFVVKGISDKIAHKTDVGAVQLNVQNEYEIEQAIGKMQEGLAENMNGDMRFLIEEMIPGAVTELNIGIKRDDQFGLALVLSMGGELVNLVNDSVPVLLPANREEIVEALYSLKGITLLTGFRGRPKGDIEAVINAAKAVASYAEANRNILLEMDINPLLVLPEGQGVVAVDAFIRTVVDTATIEDTTATL